MKIYLIIILFVMSCLVLACVEKASSSGSNEKPLLTNLKDDKEKQEQIISEHLKTGAWKYESYSREWQEEIDKGLAKDSTIAYLWQQKAMPMFKQGKHEIGMIYIDKAVKYDQQRWQPYRAFIKCIFARTYKDAIADFEDYKKRFGNGHVMDHSYDFYIGLSYLQLNEFKKAENIFQQDYENVLNERGEDWLHHLDLFYYGISRYEQKNYKGAIEMFDKALKIYPQFSDVQCYKAACLRKLGKTEEGNDLTTLCQLNAEKGFTINEDNVKYENYPYQIRWY